MGFGPRTPHSSCCQGWATQNSGILSNTVQKKVKRERGLSNYVTPKFHEKTSFTTGIKTLNIFTVNFLEAFNLK